MKTACSVFGVLVGLAALLWCVAGAGIYGSPLAALYGCREFNFLVAFLIFGPFLSLFAAVYVWFHPAGTSWLLLGGGAISSVVIGRYLISEPVAWLLTLVPFTMLLIGQLIRGASTAAGQRNSLHFSIRDLLVLCSLIAVSIAHGQAAREQMAMPSPMIQALMGISVDDLPPEFLENVPERFRSRHALQLSLYSKQGRGGAKAMLCGTLRVESIVIVRPSFNAST